MRTDEFISGLSVPKMSSEQAWTVDKTAYVSRVVDPDMYYDLGEDFYKGGRFMREAAYRIAYDMLANQAVKFNSQLLIEHNIVHMTYLAKIGSPSVCRILP